MSQWKLQTQWVFVHPVASSYSFFNMCPSYIFLTTECFICSYCRGYFGVSSLQTVLQNDWVAILKVTVFDLATQWFVVQLELAGVIMWYGAAGPCSVRTHRVIARCTLACCYAADVVSLLTTLVSPSTYPHHGLWEASELRKHFFSDVLTKCGSQLKNECVQLQVL